MFAIYLFSVATFVPAVTPMSLEPRNPLILHLLPCFVSPKGLHQSSSSFAAGRVVGFFIVGLIRQNTRNINKGSQMGHVLELGWDRMGQMLIDVWGIGPLSVLFLTYYSSRFLCFYLYFSVVFLTIHGKQNTERSLADSNGFLKVSKYLQGFIHSISSRKKNISNLLEKQKQNRQKQKWTKTKTQLTAHMHNQPRLPHRLVIQNLTIASLLLVASHSVLKDGNVFGTNFHTPGNIRTINNNLLNKSHFTRCDFLKLV